MRNPALAVHDLMRGGGHRMACDCVTLDPAEIAERVEALLAVEERWERAS